MCSHFELSTNLEAIGINACGPAAASFTAENERADASPFSLCAIPSAPEPGVVTPCHTTHTVDVSCHTRNAAIPKQSVDAIVPSQEAESKMKMGICNEFSTVLSASHTHSSVLNDADEATQVTTRGQMKIHFGSGAAVNSESETPFPDPEHSETTRRLLSARISPAQANKTSVYSSCTNTVTLLICYLLFTRFTLTVYTLCSKIPVVCANFLRNI